MKQPKVLLAEDDNYLRRNYRFSLENVGFVVTEISDGKYLEGALEKEKFEVVLSDSEMEETDGYEACTEAMKKGLLDSSVLIIGMSLNPQNQDYWRGIANMGCFYDKRHLQGNRIGEAVSQSLRNFNQGGLWKEKMPSLSN